MTTPGSIVARLLRSSTSPYKSSCHSFPCQSWLATNPVQDSLSTSACTDWPCPRQHNKHGGHSTCRKYGGQVILTMASVHSTRVLRVTPEALESTTLSVKDVLSCDHVYCGVSGILHSQKYTGRCPNNSEKRDDHHACCKPKKRSRSSRNRHLLRWPKLCTYARPFSQRIPPSTAPWRSFVRRGRDRAFESFCCVDISFYV